MNRAAIVVGATFLLSTVPVLAQIREQRVQFAPGTSSANLRGQIRGREIVDYLVNAEKGQSANISLGSKNPQAYFNIIPPSGSSTGAAIFIGSTSGNQYEGALPESGDYRVRVYLMKPAARRGEVANYALDVAISSTSKSTKNRTAPRSAASYDASAILRCEIRSPLNLSEVTHGQKCPAKISRGGIGSASIRIQLPGGGERILNFDKGNITTPGGGNLTWGKNGDTWFIGIDKREFFVVPEAAVSGG